MKKIHAHSNADYMGILGSVICIIHCLLLPAITVGSSFNHLHSVEAGLAYLDLLFVAINGFAVYFATKSHSTLWLQVFLWSAFSLFAVSILLENRNDLFVWMGYAGSGLLIVGHFINLYKCQIAPRLKFKS